MADVCCLMADLQTKAELTGHVEAGLKREALMKQVGENPQFSLVDSA
jgi:hypothetical protein